jgi:hypothetical protein
MSRCPVCDSVQILIHIGVASRASCDVCGTRWIQQAGPQRAIRRGPLSGAIAEKIDRALRPIPVHLWR